MASSRADSTPVESSNGEVGKREHPLSGNREPWIDWLKAAAIVAVVWIHTVTIGKRPDTDLARVFNHLMLFAVSAFFFVAGYTLARSGTITYEKVRSRLSRLLLPYLVASALCIAWFKPPVRTAADWLIWGGALAPYYFVPMLTVSVAAISAVAMIRGRMRRITLILIVVLSTAANVSFAWDPLVYWVYPHGALIWIMRSPFQWIGFVGAGFLAYEFGVFQRRRSVVALGCFALALLLAVLPVFMRFASGWEHLMNVAMRYLIVTAVGLSTGAVGGRIPPMVRVLSENTYPIYLYSHPVLFEWMALAARKFDLPAREISLILVGVAIPLLAASALKAWIPGPAKWIG